jgi:hypothetical protein
MAACFPARGDNAQRIAEIQDEFQEALDEETELAQAHKTDPYYTSSRGHNIGHDEMVAVTYAERILLTPSAAELRDPAAFAARLLADLEAIKAAYRTAEDDPDGYGIGTLHSISRKLEPFAQGR